MGLAVMLTDQEWSSLRDVAAGAAPMMVPRGLADLATWLLVVWLAVLGGRSWIHGAPAARLPDCAPPA